jgi:hypothetical protein
VSPEHLQATLGRAQQRLLQANDYLAVNEPLSRPRRDAVRNAVIDAAWFIAAVEDGIAYARARATFTRRTTTMPEPTTATAAELMAHLPANLRQAALVELARITDLSPSLQALLPKQSEAERIVEAGLERWLDERNSKKRKNPILER